MAKQARRNGHRRQASAMGALPVPAVLATVVLAVIGLVALIALSATGDEEVGALQPPPARIGTAPQEGTALATRPRW